MTFLQIKHNPLMSLLWMPWLLLHLSTAWANSAPQLNLDGVEIRQLVQIVAETTNTNFIIDPAVRGKVSFVTKRGLSKHELYEAFLSILQVHNLEAIKTGNLVKIVPSNKARAQVAPLVQDAAEIEVDSTVTQVFKLQYIPVNTAMSTLQPLAGQGETRIQVNQSSNSVIVTGRAQNVKRLSQVIESIDQPNSDDFELVQLRYASADKVAQTLQSLFNAPSQGGNPLVQKANVTPDQRTNSILISGDKASRERIRKAINRLDLDVPKKVEFNTKVIGLRYANAEDIVKVLNGVSPTLKQEAVTADGEIIDVVQLDGGPQGQQNINIQADSSTNSVIITAPEEVRKNLERVIARLDRRRSQVMVEAVIAEVSTNLSEQLGVGMATTPEKQVPNGVIGASNFGSGLSTLLTNLNSNLSIPSGFLFGATKSNFTAIMNALSGDAATNILATPTLVTMNNEEAEIVIGQNVPFLTGRKETDSGSDNPFQSIQRQDVGLTLKVTPQVNLDKTILLKIDQEVSSLASSSAQASDLITNKRKISTNVMVEDGQILVLGGLIQDDFRDSEQKIPILGDLPLMGRLFRDNNTSKSKQNLMVFIHPVILPDKLSADAYTRKKYTQIQQAQSKTGVLDRGGLGKNNNASVIQDFDTYKNSKHVPWQKSGAFQDDFF